MQASAPLCSIVIPVFNEERMVVPSCEALHAELLAWLGAGQFEILLAENGSRDATPALVDELAVRLPEVRALHTGEPNYGGALRHGLRAATGMFVICEEIDLCDVSFHRAALELLQADAAEFIVGSKALPGSGDRRPLGRRLATRVYNGLLRVAVGFRGTDTHGLKAFVRARVVPFAEACVVEHDVFASELVVRAQRGGVIVREIPISLEERRPPSIVLRKRVLRVLRNVARLTLAIRLGVATR